MGLADDETLIGIIKAYGPLNIYGIQKHLVVSRSHGSLRTRLKNLREVKLLPGTTKYVHVSWFELTRRAPEYPLSPVALQDVNEILQCWVSGDWTGLPKDHREDIAQLHDIARSLADLREVVEKHSRAVQSVLEGYVSYTTNIALDKWQRPK